jgi:CubicO group peptidase (beta-lactamase class C family)
MRALARGLLALALAAVVSPPLHGQELPLTETVRTDDPADLRLIGTLKAYIPGIMRAEGTPGINLAIARQGKIIWEAGFGYADLAEKRPMTPESVFHFGSIAKVYTATAIMQLTERGVIALNDPVNRHLPFHVQNPFGDREITILDLLTHRSGLSYGDAALSQQAPGKPLREALEAAYREKYQPAYEATYTPLWNAKVGTSRQYSNLGVATLGLIVEEKNPERLSLSDYVQKLIIDPLGMRFSQYPPIQDQAHVRPEIWSRMSTGYVRFGAVCLPTPAIYTIGFPAGGGLGIPGDHIKLLFAYMNDGSYNGHRLLQPETVRLMLTMVPKPPGEESLPLGNQGLVWFLGGGGAEEMFGHGGAYMFGWQNSAAVFPKRNLAVVISKNTWSLPRGGDETDLIREHILKWIDAHALLVPTHEVDEAWSWKTSYVMGLILVESMVGAVGIPAKMDEGEIEALAKRAQVMAGAPNAERGFSREGFLAGVRDLQQVDITPESIQRFIHSDKLRVSLDDLRAIYRELGGIPGTPEDYALPFFIAPGTQRP